ncbi:MAG: glucose-6-phosphate isomerase, partial [Pseudomonadota bacterium]|nr:glucose-6-phosphate isomerase [Pseudomonadota bacterium]
MPQLDFDISAALTTDTQSAFDAAIKALEAPLAGWREAPLPHFTLPEKNGDLPDLRDMAADMAVAFARVIVLGTGGSSLGAQVLAQIHGWGTPPGQSRGP